MGGGGLFPAPIPPLCHPYQLTCHGGYLSSNSTLHAITKELCRYFETLEGYWYGIMQKYKEVICNSPVKLSKMTKWCIIFLGIEGQNFFGALSTMVTKVEIIQIFGFYKRRKESKTF